MQSDQQRAIWAVILSGAVLFLWQFFFVPNVTLTKDPVAPKVEVSSTSQEIQPSSNLPPALPSPVINETFVISSKGKEVAKISSKLNIENIASLNSTTTFDHTLGEKFFLKFSLFSSDKKEFNNFTTSKVLSDGSEKVVITGEGGINLNIFADENGKILLKGNIPSGFGFGLSGKVAPIDHSVLYRNFIFFTNDLNLTKIGSETSDSGNLKWVGIDYFYHFAGLVIPTAIPSDVSVNQDGTFVSKSFPADGVVNAYLIHVEKKYDFLKSLGDSLHLTIDFGMFSFLAIPILWLLQLFYGAFANYGWAIVALTLLIRLLTFPLQWSSLKGMKKMQKLQPEMAKIKEKFKDDPQAMQKETMELFKKSGVNPLGGCFPLLLQMPIFFALYSVLYNAVELVGAKYMFWITDLSQKDPYYILPVAMAVSMFIQQKITPTTITDKVQQRIFLFMPLIFGFFMKDLPSGLSLYIFVSTIAGILQQYFVFSRIKD